MVLSRHGRSDASLRTYMGWNENKFDVRVVVEKHCNYNCVADGPGSGNGGPSSATSDVDVLLSPTPARAHCIVDS